MYDPQKLVDKFHKAFGVGTFKYGVRPDIELRAKLIEEEFDEVLEALAEYGSLLDTHPSEWDEHAFLDAKCKVAKEIADLKYVLEGTNVSLDIPGKRVFKEVHKSNMTKLGEDGKPVRRADGKFLKGPNYREADIRGVLTGAWV